MQLVVKCPKCGKYSPQTYKQPIVSIIFKCKYCEASRKAKHSRAKDAGLEWVYYGPYEDRVASRVTAELNAQGREPVFSTGQYV